MHILQLHAELCSMICYSKTCEYSLVFPVKRNIIQFSLFLWMSYIWNSWWLDIVWENYSLKVKQDKKTRDKDKITLFIILIKSKRDYHQNDYFATNEYLLKSKHHFKICVDLHKKEIYIETKCIISFAGNRIKIKPYI